MSGLISVEEALNFLSRSSGSRTTSDLPLQDASGNTLAEPVYAKVSRPPAPVSAMDGYAVRLEDVSQAGKALTVIGEAPAGKPFDGQVFPGQAVRIFTGAEIPEGADHVIIQENTLRNGEVITTTSDQNAPKNIRTAGRDFKAGDLLIAEGTKIGSSELALAAAANHASLRVFKPLRVGLLANGDELKPPGSDLKRGEIVNSNPPGLSALLKEWGAEQVDLGIAADSETAILDCISAAEDIDIFVPIGGASVGDYDYMRSAFRKAGFVPVFEKIAVKPGKPTWFSSRSGQSALGLPGNPASAFVCAHLFLQPLISRDFRKNFVSARVHGQVSANGDRENYLRAICTISPDGYLKVAVATDQDSSLIRPFLTCNALLRRRPGDGELSVGAPAEVLLIAPLRAE